MRRTFLVILYYSNVASRGKQPPREPLRYKAKQGLFICSFIFVLVSLLDIAICLATCVVPDLQSQSRDSVLFNVVYGRLAQKVGCHIIVCRRGHRILTEKNTYSLSFVEQEESVRLVRSRFLFDDCLFVR